MTGTKVWTAQGGARYLRERHRKRLDEIMKAVRVQRAIHNEDPALGGSLAASNAHLVVDQRHLYRLVAPSLQDSHIRVTVHLVHEKPDAFVLTLVAHDEFGFVPLPDVDAQAWLHCIFNGRSGDVQATGPAREDDPARQPLAVAYEWTYRLPLGG